MSPQLKDTTPLKNTLRMYFFLNERSWMLLKLLSIHLAWSKIGSHLYDKSIQLYSRLLGEDVSFFAFFSLSFQQIPSYSWYTGLLFFQTYLFPLNQPTFPHGWGTSTFLHLFNCWCVRWTGLMFSPVGRPKDQGEARCEEGTRFGCLKSLMVQLCGPQTFQSSSSSGRERKWLM